MRAGELVWIRSWGFSRGSCMHHAPSAGNGSRITVSARLLNVNGLETAEDAVGFLETILEASTEHSIIAVDAVGRIVGFNAGAGRLYGYDLAEAVGQSHSLLHTEADVRAGLPQRMLQSSLTDGSWKGVVERRRKDGSHFTGRVVLTPRRGPGDDAVGFLIISSDITEEIRLTQELERTTAFAEALLESAPDAMVIVDGEGTIRLANAELERLFGYDRETLAGRPVEVLVPQRHRGHRTGFLAAVAARPMGAERQLTGRRGDGTEFPVEISLNPLVTDAGVLVTATIRDVTEQELRAANARLESADRAKDRFLASMSHELRTPLNAILGFTGTLLMGLPGPLNDEQARQLRMVQSSGRHLLSLINDVLDLARVESGVIDLRSEPIDGRELLEEVAGGLRPLADEKGIGLEVTAPAGVEVRCDRRALSQILINLANNAIKFTDRGQVRLALTRLENGSGDLTRFSVIDSGRGIRATDQERLFAAFAQIGEPGATPYEGTGLGLYISHTLATLMGAEIAFESEFGRGSVFTLDLSE
jgi:PAS domain S-box-containing protein